MSPGELCELQDDVLVYDYSMPVMRAQTHLKAIMPFLQRADEEHKAYSREPFPRSSVWERWYTPMT